VNGLPRSRPPGKSAAGDTLISEVIEEAWRGGGSLARRRMLHCVAAQRSRVAGLGFLAKRFTCPACGPARAPKPVALWHPRIRFALKPPCRSAEVTPEFSDFEALLADPRPSRLW